MIYTTDSAGNVVSIVVGFAGSVGQLAVVISKCALLRFLVTSASCNLAVVIVRSICVCCI